MFYVQIRFCDYGESSDWEIVRSYTTALAAKQAGIRLEARNMANGADCDCRVIDEDNQVVLFPVG